MHDRDAEIEVIGCIRVDDVKCQIIPALLACKEYIVASGSGQFAVDAPLVFLTCKGGVQL